jgi:hypothetical protein
MNGAGSKPCPFSRPVQELLKKWTTWFVSTHPTALSALLELVVEGAGCAWKAGPPSWRRARSSSTRSSAGASAAQGEDPPVGRRYDRHVGSTVIVRAVLDAGGKLPKKRSSRSSK